MVVICLERMSLIHDIYTEDFSGNNTIQCDTIIVDKWHYTFAKPKYPTQNLCRLKNNNLDERGHTRIEFITLQKIYYKCAKQPQWRGWGKMWCLMKLWKWLKSVRLKGKAIVHEHYILFGKVVSCSGMGQQFWHCCMCILELKIK